MVYLEIFHCTMWSWEWATLTTTTTARRREEEKKQEQNQENMNRNNRAVARPWTGAETEAEAGAEQATKADLVTIAEKDNAFE